MSAVVTNFILFQLGWLACVLGGASEWHLFGSLFAIGLIIYHLTRATGLKHELLLILCAVLIGAAWDSSLVWFEVLDYQHGQFHSDLAPHWIIAMWGLFATTLNVSLRWLKGRWFLALLFGSVGGPLAYYAGQRLGAVEFVSTPIAITTLAVGWGFIMPLLMWLSRDLDGFQASRES